MRRRAARPSARRARRDRRRAARTRRAPVRDGPRVFPPLDRTVAVAIDLPEPAQHAAREPAPLVANDLLPSRRRAQEVERQREQRPAARADDERAADDDRRPDVEGDAHRFSARNAAVALVERPDDARRIADVEHAVDCDAARFHGRTEIVPPAHPPAPNVERVDEARDRTAEIDRFAVDDRDRRLIASRRDPGLERDVPPDVARRRVECVGVFPIRFSGLDIRFVADDLEVIADQRPAGAEHERTVADAGGTRHRMRPGDAPIGRVDAAHRGLGLARDREAALAERDDRAHRCRGPRACDVAGRTVRRIEGDHVAIPVVFDEIAADERGRRHRRPSQPVHPGRRAGIAIEGDERARSAPDVYDAALDVRLVVAFADDHVPADDDRRGHDGIFEGSTPAQPPRSHVECRHATAVVADEDRRSRDGGRGGDGAAEFRAPRDAQRPRHDGVVIVTESELRPFRSRGRGSRRRRDPGRERGRQQHEAEDREGESACASGQSSRNSADGIRVTIRRRTPSRL